MTKTGVAREDAEAFVESLRTFNDTLPPEQQALLGTILDAAQQDETAGYGFRGRRNESGHDGEDETAGYSRNRPRSESGQEAGEDETAGYATRRPRSETSGQDEEGRWERLAEWLGSAEGEDETEGFIYRRGGR